MRILISFVLTLVAPGASAFAQAPAAAAADAAPGPQIAYQGRLLEAAVPVTGSRSFTFAILDSAGTELWNSGPQNVSINNGLYAVVLGGTGQPAIHTMLLTRANLSLHLSIDGRALGPDANLIPALQSRSAWEVTGAFAGDASGTQSALTMVALQGTPVDATAPATGQVLTFDGTKWAPGSPLGSMGSQGPAGPQGSQGVAGATGPQGPKGPTGPTGPQGLMGLIGLTGPQGPQGSQGPLGPQGPQGLPGPSTFLWRNAFDPTATYATYDLVFSSGSSFLALQAVPVGTTPTSGAYWAPIALNGDTGATGAIGAKGAVGVAGTQGSQGATGAPGPTGAQGAQGLAGLQGFGDGTFSVNGTAATYTAGSVGIGTANPNPDAALEVASASQGLRFPRVALSSRASAAPLSAHVAGMLVYNTATAGDVTPGLYVDTGTAWAALGH